jgi:hypothetical protein
MREDKNVTNTVNLSEPEVIYSSSKRRKLILFKSFEQGEEYELRTMAAKTPEQRMHKLEAMRKFFLREYLTADGNWKPIKRIITMQPPKTNDEFC